MKLKKIQSSQTEFTLIKPPTTGPRANRFLPSYGLFTAMQSPRGPLLAITVNNGEINIGPYSWACLSQDISNPRQVSLYFSSTRTPNPDPSGEGLEKDTIKAAKANTPLVHAMITPAMADKASIADATFKGKSPEDDNELEKCGLPYTQVGDIILINESPMNAVFEHVSTHEQETGKLELQTEEMHLKTLYVQKRYITKTDSGQQIVNTEAMPIAAARGGNNDWQFYPTDNDEAHDNTDGKDCSFVAIDPTTLPPENLRAVTQALLGPQPAASIQINEKSIPIQSGLPTSIIDNELAFFVKNQDELDAILNNTQSDSIVSFKTCEDVTSDSKEASFQASGRVRPLFNGSKVVGFIFRISETKVRSALLANGKVRPGIAMAASINGSVQSNPVIKSISRVRADNVVGVKKITPQIERITDPLTMSERRFLESELAKTIPSDTKYPIIAEEIEKLFKEDNTFKDSSGKNKILYMLKSIPQKTAKLDKTNAQKLANSIRQYCLFEISFRYD